MKFYELLKKSNLVENNHKLAVGETVIILGNYDISGQKGKIVDKLQDGRWVVSIKGNKKYAFSSEELMPDDGKWEKLDWKSAPYGLYEIQVELSKGVDLDPNKERKTITFTQPKPFKGAILYPEAVQKMVSDNSEVKSLLKQGWRIDKQRARELGNKKE